MGLISFNTNDPITIAFASQIDQILYTQGYRTVVGDAQHTTLRTPLEAMVSAALDMLSP